MQYILVGCKCYKNVSLSFPMYNTYYCIDVLYKGFEEGFKFGSTMTSMRD